MENRAHALVAGFFVILMGGAIFYALWWFSDTREELNTYHLISTGSVSGLNPQAQVRFRGISAGKVNSIRLDPSDPRRIIVSVGIRSDLPITRGTTASLGYQGVTGLAFIQLDDRGTDLEPLRSGNGRPPQIPLEAGLLDQLSDAAMEAVQRFHGLTDLIAGFFDDDSLHRFRGALSSLENTLTTLESAAGGLDQTFQEAPQLIADLRRFLNEDNLRNVNAMLANLEQASGEVAPVARDLRSLLARAGEVLDTVDGVAQSTGDGLIQTTMPQLNTLLTDLTDTSSRLGRLIDELDASPQLLITGRSERRPGPGESGFRAEP